MGGLMNDAPDRRTGTEVNANMNFRSCLRGPQASKGGPLKAVKREITLIVVALDVLPTHPRINPRVGVYSRR